MNQKLNKTLSFLFMALAVFLVSCNTAPKQVKDQIGKEITTNTVYANETSEKHEDLAYSFIVPSKYNGKNKLPIIYFLDPQANGQKPLNKYAEIAEKQQVILVVSNNIRNGLQQTITQRYFENLLAETKTRFVIDTKQQFIAGFSGGAKLAMLYAGDYDELIGVIACGGSVPFGEGFIPNFYFAGLIGTHDFNYLELIQTQNTFTQNGFDFTSVQFEGTHEWAPAESFNLAVAGMKLYAMKSKRSTKNEAWINELYAQMNDSVVLAHENKDIIKEYEYLKQMERWFYGLKTISDLQKKTYTIEQDRFFIAEVKNKQKLTRKEIKLRTEYIRAIDSKDMEWWRAEVPKLLYPKASNKDAIDISYRLKNYISMVSFMLTKMSLDNNELDKAIKKIQVYELVDPQNHDVYLMYARYYYKLGDKQQMLTSFKKAQSLGFSNTANYLNDNSWSALFSQADIKELIK